MSASLSSSLRAGTPSLQHGAHSHFNPHVSPEDIIASCTQELQQCCGKAHTHLRRAKAYVQLRSYPSALSDLEVLLHGHIVYSDVADVNTEALFYHGVCCSRLSRPSEAVESFTAVLQRNPMHQRALYERAACYTQVCDFFQAVVDYEAALHLDEVGTARVRDRRLRRHSQRLPSRHRPAPSISANHHHAAVGATRGEPPCYRRTEAPESSHHPIEGSSTAYANMQGEPVAVWGSSGGDLQRSSSDGNTDGLVETVTLSELTMPTVNHRVRRHQQGCSDPERDVLTAVSSSTALSFDGDVDSVEEIATDSEGPPSSCLLLCSSRHEDPANAVDGLIAVDPTAIFIDSSEEDELEKKRAGPSARTGQPPKEFPPADAGSAVNVSASSSRYSSANYFYHRGLEHRRHGRLPMAVEMYTEALNREPSHFRALFNRAFCHDKLKQYKAAIEDYTAAAHLDARNPFTFYNLGISYDHSERYGSAVRAFTQAIALDDQQPDFYHNRGFTRRKMGAFAEAIADYTAAIDLDPHHFKAYYNRAYCYSKLGRYAEAIADYTAALRIDGTSANAYHNRGAARERQGALQEALADFSSALTLDPDLCFSRNARGLVYDQLQQYDRALADFTEAIHLDPMNPVWLHNRGLSYRNKGELDLAVADYTASLALAPHSFTALNSRAFALRKLGRYQEAVEDYTESLREQPGSWAKVLNNRAYCLARLNLFEDAIRDYSEVLAADQKNAHALYNRGISLEKCGRYHAAIDDFTRVIQLAPMALSSVNAYYSRGTSRLHLKRVPEAVEDLKQALRLDLTGCGLRGEALRSFQAKHPAWLVLQNLSMSASAEGGREEPRLP